MARKKINEGKEEVSVEVMKEYKLSYPKTIKKIKFKTYNQKRFYKAIEHPNHNIIMGHALAGAGKTYISIQKGLELYTFSKNIFHIGQFNLKRFSRYRDFPRTQA